MTDVLTRLDPEERCYPSGGFLRKGRAILRRNPHNPIVLPYAEVRAIRASIPDTLWTTPARLRFGGRTIQGYLTSEEGELYFTPEADPAHCEVCAKGEGCRFDPPPPSPRWGE